MAPVTPIRNFRGYLPDNALRSPTVEELRRLRCPDGHPYAFHRIGSRATGGSSPRTDALELRCHGGHDRRLLYSTQYERSLWERISGSIPEGLERGDVAGSGDTHRRHLDFPQSLFQPSAGDPQGVGRGSSGGGTSEDRALANIAFIASDHHWYRDPAVIIPGPRLGGLIPGITVPSLADAAAQRFPALQAVIHQGVRMFFPKSLPVPQIPTDEVEDIRIGAMTMWASHYGWTTFAPSVAILYPNIRGPQVAVAIEGHAGGWKDAVIAAQPWEPLVVGWDPTGDDHALLFPDYDGEGNVFASRTIAWLLRAGVPANLLNRRRGHFVTVPYPAYGPWIRAFHQAFPDASPPVAPLGPIIDMLIKSSATLRLPVPSNWNTEWNLLTGYVAP